MSESFVWVSSVSQTIQILLSLLSIMSLVRYLTDRTSTSLIFFMVFMLLNALNAGGWIILFVSIMLYCLIEKEFKLLLLNAAIFLLIGIIYFEWLPYYFFSHPFTNLKQLMLFILGFTGSTLLSDSKSFIIGAILLALTICKRKVILNNKIYLIWFIFFYANAILIGCGRVATGSYGLDSRYAIYSLVNLAFMINLIFHKRLDIVLQLTILYTLMILNITSFKQQAVKGVALRFHECQQKIYAPNINNAVAIYDTSTKLNIYNSTLLSTLAIPLVAQ